MRGREVEDRVGVAVELTLYFASMQRVKPPFSRIIIWETLAHLFYVFQTRKRREKNTSRPNLRSSISNQLW